MDWEANFGVYPLLWLLRDRQVAYVERTLLPQRIDATRFDPQAILEIVPKWRYSEALDDGRPRGREILEPQFALGYVLLFYAAPVN